MGLISTLKELLGMETPERPQRHDVEVTVERETEAGSERAVKEPVASATSSEDAAEGTATASTTGASAASEAQSADTAEPGEAEEAEEAETAAAEEAETVEPEEAETEETQPPESDIETQDIDSGTPESDTETQDIDSGTPEGDTERPGEDSGSDEPVQTIKGIGSAYAERLGTAGIETVGELAGADPDTIAAEADVPQARLEDWIERAKTMQ